jgi:hypothetical protein
MRWTGGLIVVAAFGLGLGLVGSAFGAQPGCLGCNQSEMLSIWGAEACASPAGHALVPGCCPEHRRCCDNAWAGYCDHRARVEAYWAQAGTGAPYPRCRPCRQTMPAPCDSCETFSTPVVQPTPPPAVPVPAPAPAAESSKNIRNTYNNRLW